MEQANATVYHGKVHVPLLSCVAEYMYEYITPTVFLWYVSSQQKSHVRNFESHNTTRIFILKMQERDSLGKYNKQLFTKYDNILRHKDITM